MSYMMPCYTHKVYLPLKQFVKTCRNFELKWEQKSTARTDMHSIGTAGVQHGPDITTWQLCFPFSAQIFLQVEDPLLFWCLRKTTQCDPEEQTDCKIAKVEVENNKSKEVVLHVLPAFSFVSWCTGLLRLEHRSWNILICMERWAVGAEEWTCQVFLMVGRIGDEVTGMLCAWDVDNLWKEHTKIHCFVVAWKFAKYLQRLEPKQPWAPGFTLLAGRWFPQPPVPRAARFMTTIGSKRRVAASSLWCRCS